MKIYEYTGKKNSQNIEHGTPFLIIGFCDGEWELSETNWNDVENNHDAIQYSHNNLLVDYSIKDDDFKKYFKFNCEIAERI